MPTPPMESSSRKPLNDESFSLRNPNSLYAKNDF